MHWKDFALLLPWALLLLLQPQDAILTLTIFHRHHRLSFCSACKNPQRCQRTFTPPPRVLASLQKELFSICMRAGSWIGSSELYLFWLFPVADVKPWRVSWNLAAVPKEEPAAWNTPPWHWYSFLKLCYSSLVSIKKNRGIDWHCSFQISDRCWESNHIASLSSESFLCKQTCTFQQNWKDQPNFGTARFGLLSYTEHERSTSSDTTGSRLAPNRTSLRTPFNEPVSVHQRGQTPYATDATPKMGSVWPGRSLSHVRTRTQKVQGVKSNKHADSVGDQGRIGVGPKDSSVIFVCEWVEPFLVPAIQRLSPLWAMFTGHKSFPFTEISLPCRTIPTIPAPTWLSELTPGLRDTVSLSPPAAELKLVGLNSLKWKNQVFLEPRGMETQGSRTEGTPWSFSISIWSGLHLRTITAAYFCSGTWSSASSSFLCLVVRRIDCHQQRANAHSQFAVGLTNSFIGWSLCGDICSDLPCPRTPAKSRIHMLFFFSVLGNWRVQAHGGGKESGRYLRRFCWILEGTDHRAATQMGTVNLPPPQKKRHWRHNVLEQGSSVSVFHDLFWKLGPEKGAVHLAVAAIINSLWDLWARIEGKVSATTHEPLRGNVVHKWYSVHSCSTFLEWHQCTGNFGRPRPWSSDFLAISWMSCAVWTLSSTSLDVHFSLSGKCCRTW